MNAIKNLFIDMFYSHSMSNIPEVSIYLVQTQGVIEQVLKVIETTLIYSDFTARNAVILLTKIAQCKEGQLCLLREEIIEKVHNGVSKRKILSTLLPAVQEPQITLIK